MAKNVEIGVKIDVDKAKKDLDNLAASIKKLNEAGDANEKEVKALEKQYDQLSANIAKAEKSSKGMVSSMAELPGPVGSAAKGIQGLTTAAKAFIATPVGAVITAIVGALALMKTALASSEEGQLKLAKVTGTLKGVMTGLKEVLVQVAPLIADVFSGNWGKITEDWNKVKDAFGNISNVAQQSGEIAVSRQQLTRATAEWAKQEAILNGEIEKQRVIAEDQSKSEAARAAANKKIYELENKIIDGQIALKEKDIALTKQEQALASNTLEDNVALINLEAELQNLQTQKIKNENNYNKLKNRINKQGKKDAAEEEKATKEEFERQKKHNQDLINLQQIKVNQLRKGTEEWKKEQDELIRLQYNAEIFAAENDETLKQIAEEKRKQATNLAKETAIAYQEAMAKTYAKLSESLAPDMTEEEKLYTSAKAANDAIAEQLKDSLADQLITQEQYDELSVQLERKRADDIVAIEKELSDKRRDMYLATTNNLLDSLSTLASEFGEKNESMFNVNKGLQIASATIEGARGAIKIWADETAPTAVKVAESAALAAATAATIAKISKTTFDGKTGATNASSGTISTAQVDGQRQVNDTLISRSVSRSIRPETQTVLVVDDVTAKQKQAKQVNVVSRV